VHVLGWKLSAPAKAFEMGNAKDEIRWALWMALTMASKSKASLTA